MGMKEMDIRREVEIELDFPVQLADRVLEKVKMRRPKMKDMLKFDLNNPGIEDSFKLIADLCGMVPDELQEIDAVDFEKLQNQFLLFRGVAAPKRGDEIIAYVDSFDPDGF